MRTNFRFQLIAALRNHGPTLGLVLVLAASAGLALVWVFRVPINQAPDEPMNWDYALAINRHGGLFVVHGSSYHELPTSVHPYTEYLARRTWTNGIAFQPAHRMPPEYGTPEFYASIDREAPPWDVPIEGPNRPFAVYPFGYYVVLSLWVGLVHCFNEGPIWTFFGARILSVVLLVISLLLSYATLRRLRYKPSFALLLTACIGLFPMTTFVASAVQSDNLAFALVSLCFYLAVRTRQAPENAKLLACLGLALGALLVTKQHFYVCVFLPTVAMLATRLRGNLTVWLRTAFLLGVPSVLLGGLYLWTTWGTKSYYTEPARTTDALTHALNGFKWALTDYFAGNTHDSFWGVFGWMDTPLVLRGRRTTFTVRFAIQAVAWVVLGLTLLRLEQVGSRLGRLAWRGRVRLAVRLACSDPLMNAYFLFTVMMFYLHIRLDNRFGAQGRNWFPLLLPIFLAAVVYAPKALTLRPSRRVLSALLVGGLFLYCLVGGYYALHTIERRYYLSDRERQALAARQAEEEQKKDEGPAFPAK